MKKQFNFIHLLNSLILTSKFLGDFIHKMSISLKEARETNYWLKILIATEKKLEQRLLPLLNESNELISILHAIIKNSKTQN